MGLSLQSIAGLLASEIERYTELTLARTGAYILLGGREVL